MSFFVSRIINRNEMNRQSMPEMQQIQCIGLWQTDLAYQVIDAKIVMTRVLVQPALAMSETTNG